MSVVPGVRAHLRRRLLVSYRLDPETARTLVPAPLRPQLVNGQALAGFCVLGLDGVRPRWAPAGAGLRSENAAHRIAVEWDDDGVVRSGVYILERHSSAWHPVLFGGRLFPGVHRRARFTTDERGDRYAMTMDAEGEHLAADVEVGGAWASSLFASVEEASAFYRAGRIGWSLGHDGVTLEAVALAAEEWAVEGARIRGVRSSFFEALPDGAAELDHVVVMRDLEITMEAPTTGADTRARAAV
ncbi:MAG: hypothetical protein B7X41_10385 [Microbacterium sp. 14-71-5]|uniref:DUF2071 domain-containing protein n=1 Tax=Microbacterium sp. 13-71-7 TaxID=1970399 RepID=UPI000BCF6ABF|nr:DUF2071 domain-containing protein [Microbacterium sp. 13-71-7]OZB83559.1 MAG: hypothetical protein B7X32_09950 [Microbacterium sp. 13-71-7]OZB88012.1 MAG: hypothetical protein B7X41_10385 [Microbacterium sp. 14-71-5]